MNTLVLYGGLLIDGTNHEPYERPMIVIEDHRIAEIGTWDQFGVNTRDALVIDQRDKTFLPGLIDAHVHICLDGDPNPDLSLASTPAMSAFRAARNLSRTIEAGILTVRETGAPHGISFSAKQAVNTNVIPGPRLLVCGAALTMTGGHGHHMSKEVDGADNLRRAARQQLKDGADFIKLMATGGVVTEGEALGAPQLTINEMGAAVNEAHNAGKRCAAHAIGDIGIRNALQAGVDTIEHGVNFSDDTIQLMLEKKVFLVPTFSPAYTQALRGKELGMAVHVIGKARQAWESHADCIVKAARAGVPLVAGTDAGGPGVMHGTLAFEIELMFKTGACKTAMECIQSATANGACALGLDQDLGTLEPGKIADLLVVDGDPLKDLSVLRRVELVVKSGQLHRIMQ